MTIDRTDTVIIYPRAISNNPEDPREPEPGQIFARVSIRKIRHPSIKSGPDDPLDDFVAL